MSETKTTIYTALLQAQKDMKPVVKDGKANYGKYATLDSVIETISEVLHKNGLVFLQPLAVVEGEQYIRTMIIHAATGEQVDSFYKVVCKDPQNPQAVGGALTYGRRYSLVSMLGLDQDDDDGATASRSGQTSSIATEAESGACEIPGCFNVIKDIAKSKRFNDGHAICYFHSTNGNWREQLAQGEAIEEPTAYDIAKSIGFDEMPEGVK
jgi:hypothetical protein